MGSGGSKGKASCGGAGASSSSSLSSSSSSSGGRRGRSRGKNRIFQSSCLRPSGSHDDVDEEVKIDDYRKVKLEQSDDDDRPCISSNAELDEWRQASRATSSSAAGDSSRFFSRFNLVPGNVSFRLRRAASLGSSRAYPVSSSGLAVMHDDNETPMRSGANGNVVDGTETDRPRTPVDRIGDSSGVRLDIPPYSSNLNGDLNLHSPRIFHQTDGVETRHSDRRVGAREPAERNVRFSRTLSVGRLRDRVLRRSSLSEVPFCPLQQEREEREARQGTETQSLRSELRASATSLTPPPSGHGPSSVSSSMSNVQNHDVETSSRSREARYHDLLEHRSNFIERRRRIRSQVRALQRLGNRFENLSGHERSCILSGQHRSGRCTCRVNNRDSNTNDDNSARASISRIVMLAEALFEVLDEIHQQSVVLSSRPSVSSIGSVPAPTEVVESLPVKIYAKSNKLQNDEAAQCYICLVEYEDGDSMRVLPCNHEFHKTCIDKWLKEIHRVCPLCRGDICRSDSVPAEN